LTAYSKDNSCRKSTFSPSDQHLVYSDDNSEIRRSKWRSAHWHILQNGFSSWQNLQCKS